ncbi:unnamed protein product [Gongylonema pulchrum]|uniref:Na_Ca_ex domain-containing protein n=1 Tax=Gongylonema pulchrum TaxID=637853 RepID=A0A183DY93_9BILA|nr:unnamed protein product [Gongylonema pulchrum]
MKLIGIVDSTAQDIGRESPPPARNAVEESDRDWQYHPSKQKEDTVAYEMERADTGFQTPRRVSSAKRTSICPNTACVTEIKARKWFPFTFVGSILWIAFYSYLMVWMANTIGETMAIPTEIIGLTILAAGTSIPDLITRFAPINFS